MIGMIIPDVTNPFFPAVVRGAEDLAFSNGYRLILCNTDNDHAKELTHLNELRTYLPSGLIVIPSSFSDLTAQAQHYRKAGTAVVCVDRLRSTGTGTPSLPIMKTAPIARPAICFRLAIGNWQPSPGRFISPTRRSASPDFAAPCAGLTSPSDPNISRRLRSTSAVASPRPRCCSACFLDRRQFSPERHDRLRSPSRDSRGGSSLPSGYFSDGF